MNVDHTVPNQVTAYSTETETRAVSLRVSPPKNSMAAVAVDRCESRLGNK